MYPYYQPIAASGVLISVGALIGGLIGLSVGLILQKVAPVVWNRLKYRGVLGFWMTETARLRWLNGERWRQPTQAITYGVREKFAERPCTDDDFRVYYGIDPEQWRAQHTPTR